MTHSTPVAGDIDQESSLQLTSPQFDDDGQLPDSAGYANENTNPSLEISGVPEGTESLVLIMDDPDAKPVAGHVFDHWFVWDIDPETTEIPGGWVPKEGIEGYNDFVEQGYSGPTPPEGSHGYRIKLLALDSTVEMPPETRKQRLGSAIAMEANVLGATQIVGNYDAAQGTAF